MRSDTRFRLVLVLAGLVGLAGAALVVRRAPPPPLLVSEGAAQWIRHDRPIGLGIWKRRDTTTHFRTRFTLEQASPAAVLTLRAFGSLLAPARGATAALVLAAGLACVAPAAFATDHPAPAGAEQHPDHGLEAHQQRPHGQSPPSTTSRIAVRPSHAA